MREQEQKGRPRPGALSLFGVAAVLVTVAAVPAQSPDPEYGRCSPEVEQRLDACQGGTQDVWHYLSQGPRDKAPARSWPYKSRERAQRALEADQRLCQSVDRYFDGVDCRTRYGPVFCAACQSRDNGIDWWRADVKNSLAQQIEKWDGLVAGAAFSIRNVEKGGIPPSGSRFGSVFRDYVTQLKNARDRVRALQSLLHGSSREMDEISRVLARLDSEIRTVERAGRSFQTPPEATAPQSASPIINLSAACARGLPAWQPVCDQAVDALFSAAKSASPSELVCLKEWRAYHNCIGVYAHDRNPNPPPSCMPPPCQPR